MYTSLSSVCVYLLQVSQLHDIGAVLPYFTDEETETRRGDVRIGSGDPEIQIQIGWILEPKVLFYALCFVLRLLSTQPCPGPWVPHLDFRISSD